VQYNAASSDQPCLRSATVRCVSDLTDLRSVAYFYPEPFWSGDDGSAIKNLLPFFDEVAILLPNYMYGRHRDASPWLTGPLEDAGLLRVLEPGEFIDQSMIEQLFGIMSDLLVVGAFDQLKIDDSPYGYHELSRSRLGWNADLDLSTLLTEELIRRKLALPSQDGVSVPLHPVVRTTILVLLSQLAPAVGRKQSIELLPVTPHRDRISDLLTVLRLPHVTGQAQVVALDVETVGVDLSSLPLDEVLSFRTDHGEQHRAYLRSIRQFTRVLSSLSHDEASSAVADRQEELADLAADLRHLSRRHWKKPIARVAVGGAGAILSAVTGSPLAAAFAGIAALLEWDGEDVQAGAFSYLFELQRSLG
jgi:hypothetical protein